jgi:magnesium transporter
MPAFLMSPGSVVASQEEDVRRALDEGRFFWLDLHRPGPEDFRLLRDVFGFHPLAVEDSEHFGQRAKIEDYSEFVFLVVFGAAPDEDRLVEVHCFYSERFLVTVRQDEAPALDELRRRCSEGALRFDKPIGLLYRTVDALVDSFFPVLAEVDDRLDDLQEEMLSSPADAQLAELFALRRRLVVLRRAVSPERDVFGRLLSGAVNLPGLNEEAERYFRDVYDHLIRLAEQMDGHRDLIAGATDLYLSTQSTRLNSVTKQLAVIATIFLPLTFITGFFGQNFPWLVAHIGGVTAFVILGLLLELAAVAVLLLYFKRRGWF